MGIYSLALALSRGFSPGGKISLDRNKEVHYQKTEQTVGRFHG